MFSVEHYTTDQLKLLAETVAAEQTKRDQAASLEAFRGAFVRLQSCFTTPLAWTSRLISAEEWAADPDQRDLFETIGRDYLQAAEDFDSACDFVDFICNRSDEYSRPNVGVHFQLPTPNTQTTQTRIFERFFSDNNEEMVKFLQKLDWLESKETCHVIPTSTSSGIDFAYLATRYVQKELLESLILSDVLALMQQLSLPKKCEIFQAAILSTSSSMV